MWRTCRSNKLKYQLNLYQLRENRQIKPKAFMHMVSNLLYSRRYSHLNNLIYVCLYVLMYYISPDVYMSPCSYIPYMNAPLLPHMSLYMYMFVGLGIISLSLLLLDWTRRHMNPTLLQWIWLAVPWKPQTLLWRELAPNNCTGCVNRYGNQTW